MSLHAPDRPRKRLPVFLFLVFLLAAAIGAGAWFLRPRFESQAPRVQLTPDAAVVGLVTLEIEVSDAGAGLESVVATLSSGGTDHPIASEQYARPVPVRKFALALGKVAGLKEGPAVLRVTARDASLANLFRGNETVVQRELTIDATPPTLELIADDRYVNFGGVGAIVYRPGADTATSGVRVGERFFPGFPGAVQGHPERHFALFAHPYDAPADARAVLVATDKAGNTREMPLAYELKNVKYRKSTIALGDAFLQNKVAPLVKDLSARQGAPRDVFVAVNKHLRKENEETIAAITRKATPTIQWKGAFAQLSNSKVEANFADFRTYVYGKEPVDSAYHLGYDLSVTRAYPVEAANAGTVAFVGDLGIYGNTVILDHGQGLFTLYSHLSAIGVKAGDAVDRRGILGRTGETGLAAGDHLHYGVYLHGVAVLPVEWWDEKWIRDNIEPKLEGRSGPEIAEAQQAARRPARGGRR